MNSSFFFFEPIALFLIAGIGTGLWCIRKWITLGGVFLIFFLVSAFLNAVVINTAYHASDLDDWMCLVSPLIMFFPFAFLIYCMERKARKPSIAVVIAGLGALPVTAIWFVATAFFTD